MGHEVAALSGFDITIRTFMQQRNITVGALAVTVDGRLVLAHGYTWDEDMSYSTRPDSVFRIASLSKPLTAMAILRLAQEGRLSLDDRITDLLQLQPPAGGAADPRLQEVTIAHLLYHVGGWDIDLLGFDPMFYDHTIALESEASIPMSQTDIIAFMTGTALNHNPGTVYAYSNYGYLLLGRIIEAVSAQPYQSYVQQSVLAPLGIDGMQVGSTLPAGRLPNEVTYNSTHSGLSIFDTSGDVVPYPDGAFNLENMDSHGGWVASVVDMARFAASLDDPSANPVLSSDSIERMFSPREGTSPAQGVRYYAMGWEVRDFGENRTTWHSGSLAGTFALMVRRWDGVGWVVLFNQRDDTHDRHGVSYWDIDWMLHEAADSIAVWPSRDLFAEYP
jgi:CubicO group peptidase (beta-lactamase class C family)